MAKNALVVAGPKLQKVLKDIAAGVKNTDLSTKKNSVKNQSIITRMGGESKPSSYNGYFTLKDVSTYNEDGTAKEYRVAVCDGETWDPETEKSGVSKVQVDGIVLNFDSKIFTITEDISVYVKTGPNSSYKNTIVVVPLSQKPERLGYIYYYIGDVRTNKKSVTNEETGENQEIVTGISITQRHGVSNLAPVTDSRVTWYDGYNGIPHLSYPFYKGYFSVRHIENDDTGECDPQRILVCDGNNLTQQEADQRQIVRGNDFTKYIPYKEFTITESGYIQIICGISSTYKCFLRFLPYSAVSWSSFAAPGYISYDIAKVDVTETGIKLKQLHGEEANNLAAFNGTVYLPNNGYHGDFSIRFTENDDGTFDSSNVTVCGSYWNSESGTGSASYFYVNGYMYQFNPVKISLSPGLLYLVYNPSDGNVEVTQKFSEYYDSPDNVSFNNRKSGIIIGQLTDSGEWVQNSTPFNFWVLTYLCERSLDED
jgi:hypothetical protein